MIPALDPQACVGGAWQFTADLAVRVMILAGMVGLTVWAAGQRFFPGKRAFVAMAVVTAAWVAGALGEHAATDPVCKGTIALITWPAIIALPPLWALFLHQYLSSETRAPRARHLALLVAQVAVLGAVALSNGAHGLFYEADTTLTDPIHGAPRMAYAYGPMFRATVAIGYAWLAFAAVLVLRGHAQAAPEHRGQWRAFLLVMAIPVLANVAYLAFGVRVLGGDPTVLAFAASVLGFGWMIRWRRLFDLVPIARRLLFSELPDPVLILDGAGRVVEANAAAAQLAGGRLPRGTPLGEWPRFGAALDAHLARLAPGAQTGALTLAAPDAVYDVRQRAIGEGARRIGTMVLLHDVTGHRNAHTEVVQTLAARDAELDRAAKAQAQLLEQAMRDPLTGLYNRRALDARFRQDMGHAEQTGRPLAMALVDLDHFKSINDTHGHAAGDAVLRDFGEALRAGLRSSDTVFRFGGEEFALLLPGADADQAATRIEAMRRSLADRDLGGIGRRITFSAGIAAVQGTRVALESLLDAADKALYEAKIGGRSRSVVSPRLRAEAGGG